MAASARQRGSRRVGEPRQAAGAGSDSGVPTDRRPKPRWFQSQLERLRDVREPLLIPLVLLLASRILFALAQPFANEDAYITFRYAKNLANGLGLAYNTGERIMGFTSLPWTLWCALGIGLRLDPVVWTQVTSILADILTLCIATEVLAATGPRLAAWAFAMFFAAWPLFAASAVSGLESSVLVLLLVATAIAIERKSRWAGAALGLLSIFRPEGLVAAVVLSLRATNRARFVAAGVLVATIAFLTWHFGSPIPHSATAKAALYGAPGPWLGRHWWDWLVPFPLGRYPTASEGLQLMPLAILLVASAISGARELWARRSTAVALAAAGGLAVWAIYAALGVAWFWWYFVTPLACIALVAAIGLPKVVRGPLIPVMALCFVFGSWTLGLPLYLGRARAEYTNNVSVAELLLREARPGSTVLLEPIGMIGYGTDLRVIDEAGLVTPDVVRRRLAGPGWYADLALARRPDWLVVRTAALVDPEGYSGAGAPFRSPAERDAVMSRYRLEWPTEPLSGIVLRVYRRVD